MDDETKKRVALNEATFRSINEGVRGERADGRVSFLCECGRLGCNRLIALTRPEYEAVRGHARRFAIVPGHEIPEAESVVERHQGYTVVEKHPGTANIAEQTDPRRPLTIERAPRRHEAAKQPSVAATPSRVHPSGS